MKYTSLITEEILRADNIVKELLGVADKKTPYEICDEITLKKLRNESSEKNEESKKKIEKKRTKKESAEILGIPMTSYCRYLKRGCPEDIEEAKKWIAENTSKRKIPRKEILKVLKISIDKLNAYRKKGMPEDIEEAKKWIADYPTRYEKRNGKKYPFKRKDGLTLNKLSEVTGIARGTLERYFYAYKMPKDLSPKEIVNWIKDYRRKLVCAKTRFFLRYGFRKIDFASEVGINIGSINFLMSIGMPMDIKKAKKWVAEREKEKKRIIADKLGISVLSFCNYLKEGCPLNYTGAKEFIQNSVRNIAEEFGIHSSSVYYYLERGCPKNLEGAKKWVSENIYKGDSTLRDALGLVRSTYNSYVRKGMPLDLEGAKKWVTENRRFVTSKADKAVTAKALKISVNKMDYYFNLGCPLDIEDARKWIADYLVNRKLKPFELGKESLTLSEFSRRLGIKRNDRLLKRFFAEGMPEEVEEAKKWIAENKVFRTRTKNKVSVPSRKDGLSIEDASILIGISVADYLKNIGKGMPEDIESAKTWIKDSFRTTSIRVPVVGKVRSPRTSSSKSKTSSVKRTRKPRKTDTFKNPNTPKNRIIRFKKKFGTIKSVAEKLGVNSSTLRGWICSAKIPTTNFEAMERFVARWKAKASSDTTKKTPKKSKKDAKRTLEKKNDTKVIKDKTKSSETPYVVGSNKDRPLLPSASASFNDTTKTIVSDDSMKTFARSMCEKMMREFATEMSKSFAEFASSEKVSVSSSENSTNIESEFPTKNRNAAQLFFDFTR